MDSPAPTPYRLAAGCLIVDPSRSGIRHDADLAVVGDRIVSITDAGKPNGTDWVIGALADAHDHSRGLPTLSYGAHDEALEIWLASLGEQPVIDAGLLAASAFAKLARSGVGAVVHCHNPQQGADPVTEATSVCEAARAVGVRLAYVVPIADRNALGYGSTADIAAHADPTTREHLLNLAGTPTPSADEQLALVDAIADAVEGPGVTVQYGPVGPQWASLPLLEAIAEASDRTGRRVHTHLLETELQREWADAHHPDGVVAMLDRIGLLTPRLTVAHGVWLDDADLALLAERGVIVSVNSSSNLRLRSGIAPVARMKAMGTSFAFGMDGMSLDDDEDALRELRLTQLLHAGLGLDEGLTPAEALTRATSVGHTAVDGSTDHGIIGPGTPADLVVLDGAALASDVAAGACDELTLIVARACARHVRQVIVGGRLIVDDGRVLGIDEAEVTSEIARRCKADAERLAARRPLVEAHRAALADFYRAGGHRRVPTTEARA